MKKLIVILAVIAIFVTTLLAADISSLVKELGDSNKDKAKAASSELAKMGKSVVPELIKALQDGNKNRRRYAARALREMGQDASDAIPALSDLLKDGDTDTRGYAVEALGNMSNDANAVMPFLKKAREDSDKEVREKAKDAIGKLNKGIKKGQVTNKSDVSSASSPEEVTLLPDNCIKIDKGAYDVPLNATLAEVMEWSKKYNLTVLNETDEYYKKAIIDSICDVKAIEKEDFCGWPGDPCNPNLPDIKKRNNVLRNKLSTAEGKAYLEQKLTNISPEFKTDFEYVSAKAEQSLILRLRYYLAALGNSSCIDEKGNHPLEPVYSFQFLFRGDKTPKETAGLVKLLGKLRLSRVSKLGEKEPLNAMDVFFILTADGQWKSYAALATFDKSEHQKIINILDSKYGSYRWVKSCKINQRSAELQKFLWSLKLLACIDVGTISDYNSADFLVWRGNIFDYGHYSDAPGIASEKQHFSLDHEYRNPYFNLFYYDAESVKVIEQKLMQVAVGLKGQEAAEKEELNNHLENKF